VDATACCWQLICPLICSFSILVIHPVTPLCFTNVVATCCVAHAVADNIYLNMGNAVSHPKVFEEQMQ